MAAWPDRKYFGVVADTAGRHGLWPISRPPPTGWRTTGYSADRAGCVAYAARAWSDIRPLSGWAASAPVGVAPDGSRARRWPSLTELFADSVRRRPDAIAISAGRVSLTYRDLAARSDRLAATLRRLGVGAEDRVALHLGGGIDLVVALLGVLKAGAAYIPLDVRAPLAQRRAAVASGGARLALIRPGWSFRLTSLGCPTLAWSSDQAAEAVSLTGLAPLGGRAPLTGLAAGRSAADDPDRAAGPDSAACVLFTREPRGTPLGVVIEHSQLIGLALDRAFDSPGLAAGGQIAVTSAGSLIAEVWHALATCAHLVILPTLARPADLGAELTRREITMMLAPALVIDLVQQRQPRAFASLSTLCSIGPLAPATCRSILDSGFGGRLLTVHGSAETTMAYAASEITGTPGPAARGPGIPLGRPLAGCDLYLLDSELHPVAPGTVGELYVGGVRVSRGYLGDPGLTVSRFLPDPFATASRMHATGTCARQRDDGAFEYLGRVASGG